MQASIIVFPGSNCDRDVAVALERASDRPPALVWHRESTLPKTDLIVLPGGFSYGDYLRPGAMAAQSPVMAEVRRRSASGVPVLGICNGFQLLTETGLLPGALMRNASLRFICRAVPLRVEMTDTPFTRRYRPGQTIALPIAHHDGNYFADADTLDRLEGEGRVAFRYCSDKGEVTAATNPNGSQRNIAGLFNETGKVLGMMPHPERAADAVTGGTDGGALFAGLVEALS